MCSIACTIYRIQYIIYILYCASSYTTERVRRKSQHAEVPEGAGSGGVGRQGTVHVSKYM